MGTLRHKILMGPPGSGKTIWARRHARSVELEPGPRHVTAYAWRVAGLSNFDCGVKTIRAPHYTAPAAAVYGRLLGHRWQPGELSLVHGGVLFLDELPEFSRAVLEGLSEVLRTKVVVLASDASRLEVPADFTLVGAMSPCPCGYYNASPSSSRKRCECDPAMVQGYRARVPKELWTHADVLGPDEYAILGAEAGGG